MTPRKKPDTREMQERLARLQEELDDLRAAFMGAALDDVKRPAGAFPVLTFVAGGIYCAVPLWAVMGVSWAAAPVEERRLSAPYIGLVNYHGDLIPLVDGADAFGETRRAITSHDQIIYIAAAGRRAGLLVDDALDVENLDGSRITMAGEAGVDRKLYFGVLERKGELIRIVEPAGIATGVAFGQPPARGVLSEK